VKVPDLQINLITANLRTLGKCALGSLAQTCGITLNRIANPLATIISIRLSGLDGELFAEGPERYRQTLSAALNDYEIGGQYANRPQPNQISINTDEGKTIAIAVIKHLGDPIGHIAAISDDGEQTILPIADAVWLCSSQLTIRVYSILTPNSPMAAEILGRQILTELHADGVKTLTIGTVAGPDDWVSLSHHPNGISVKEIERLPQDQVGSISDGEIIGEKTLKYLWSDLQIAAGLWISSNTGYCLALGFEDRKLLDPLIISSVKKHIEKKALSDSAYIIKSFEKLKSDFKKLVNSERVAAITETTVTINHEINNPLTAILGNTQLLLMSKDKLPADIVAKLETIERSAVKIRETTAKLMSIIDPVISPYASGLEMIDIEKSKKKKSS
jgi:hypothetical protein